MGPAFLCDLYLSFPVRTPFPLNELGSLVMQILDMVEERWVWVVGTCHLLLKDEASPLRRRCPCFFVAFALRRWRESTAFSAVFMTTVHSLMGRVPEFVFFSHHPLLCLERSCFL